MPDRETPPKEPVSLVVPAGDFPEAAVEVVAATLRELGGRSSRALSLALSGGSTPRPVYRGLGALRDLPWSRLSLYFADERRVPPADRASNYRMVRETLLAGGNADPRRLFRMRGEEPDPDQAAEAYASLLPDRLDLLLLGVGADGHTASLFPGATTLEERRRPVLPATAPSEPHDRLTITPPVIQAARRVIVLATGAGKARAVTRALRGEWAPRACPAQLARHGTWILDEGAAAYLRDPPSHRP